MSTAPPRLLLDHSHAHIDASAHSPNRQTDRRLRDDRDRRGGNPANRRALIGGVSRIDISTAADLVSPVGIVDIIDVIDSNGPARPYIHFA